MMNETRGVVEPVDQVRRKGSRRELKNNPMNQRRVMTQLLNIRAARRCGAKTRSGGECQCPAIRNRKRCRLHGGRSTGAPKGRSNGNYKDGTFTAEAIEERRWVKSMVAGLTKEGQS